MTIASRTATTPPPDRESIGEPPDPLGLCGIEYVEYRTGQPQALGHVLETMGFKPVARHRSREVLLYRQGGMNIVVNAQPGAGHGRPVGADGLPCISAVALRVRDARAAYERALDLGAWDVPMHAQVMELNIPAIHGPGGAHLYFVDRWREFSIYSVDFTPIPGVDPAPPALAGLHWFGVVQYVGSARTADWCEFYSRLFGFVRLGDGARFGILPGGTLLQSPGEAAGRFWMQLIEPDTATPADDGQEVFHRIGFGAPDVPAAVALLRRQGVDFVESDRLSATTQGALTRQVLHAVVFELVHDEVR